MERIWRSKTNFEPSKVPPIVSQSKQPLYLPNYIGCKIIELEMQVLENEQVTKQMIIELLQEYTKKAVEFYEEKGDDKFQLYKKKMHTFIQKPYINQILNGRKSQMIIKKEKNQEQLRKANTQAMGLMKKMVESCHEEALKKKIIISKEIESQELKFEERLQRKRANSNRLPRAKGVSASFGAPSSAQPQSRQRQAQFQISQFQQVLPPSRQRMQ